MKSRGDVVSEMKLNQQQLNQIIEFLFDKLSTSIRNSILQINELENTQSFQNLINENNNEKKLSAELQQQDQVQGIQNILNVDKNDELSRNIEYRQIERSYKLINFLFQELCQLLEIISTNHLIKQQQQQQQQQMPEVYFQISNELLRKIHELNLISSTEENITNDVIDNMNNNNNTNINISNNTTVKMKNTNNPNFEAYLNERKKYGYQINKWIKIIKNQFVNSSNKTD